ncbi:hypothetical protein PG999_014216 [Apiospora kogelbergensis]|uniref:DUF397 domain-containing protein n=1 Tax=Apiospora kogelbergensis TaxID=1337665 RepID=A0AAW0QC93_9PEZI
MTHFRLRGSKSTTGKTCSLEIDERVNKEKSVHKKEESPPPNRIWVVDGDEKSGHDDLAGLKGRQALGGGARDSIHDSDATWGLELQPKALVALA